MIDHTAEIAAIRRACLKLPAGETVTTSSLVTGIWPKDRPGWVGGRDALYKALGNAKVREALADCYTKGPAQASRFGEKRPFLWHLPKVQCDHCKGTGYVDPAW